jgi:hypothetical protein
MSCLDATFTLTPRSPLYLDPHNYNNYAYVFCYGADFWAGSPNDLSSLYANNRFFFDPNFAGDPNLDYTKWDNLKKTPYLYSHIVLAGYAGTKKQLALIFGFDVLTVDGRVLVYSSAGLLQDQTLVYGDNQFLLEIESLDQEVYLYFVHAGAGWYFKGLSGYVV